MKNQPKTEDKAKPDKDPLLQTTPKGEVQLTEEELDKVAGGNKAKTADKAFKIMDEYIRD